MGDITTLGSPLSLIDWIGVESSALLYGARLWVQWAQSALSRARRLVRFGRVVRFVPSGLEPCASCCLLVNVREPRK